MGSTEVKNVRPMDAAAFEEMVDALDHIARTCRGSHTQTRRIRWIQNRATCALSGEDWRDVDTPKMDPYIEALRELITMVYPLALGWRDVTAMECSDQEPTGDPADAQSAAEELATINRFIAGVDQHMHWLKREHASEDQAAGA